MEKQRIIITDITNSRRMTNRSALWDACQSKGMTMDSPLSYQGNFQARLINAGGQNGFHAYGVGLCSIFFNQVFLGPLYRNW